MKGRGDGGGDGGGGGEKEEEELVVRVVQDVEVAEWRRTLWKRVLGTSSTLHGVIARTVADACTTEKPGQERQPRLVSSTNLAGV